jgi:hypothetical protein
VKGNRAELVCGAGVGASHVGTMSGKV